MKKMIVIFLIAALAGCANPVLDNDIRETVQQNRDLALPRVEGLESLPSVLLLGDSRVEGIPIGLFANEFHTINCGLGGSKSSFVVSALMQISSRYDAIIISTGINDSGTGENDEFNLMQTLTNLENALAYASVWSDHVFITTIPGCCNPSAYSPDRVNVKSLHAHQVNEYIPTLAGWRGATVIPLSEKIGVGCWLNPAYTMPDGIHYNSAGYTKLHDLYVSMIEVTE